MLISLWQYGQIFVVGSAGSSFFVSPTSLLIPFIRQKRINAMMIKFTAVARNEDANPATSDKEYVAPPVRTFRIGFMKLSVSDVTIPGKSTTNNNTDCHIHDISTERKSLKFLYELFHL